MILDSYPMENAMAMNFYGFLNSACIPVVDGGDELSVIWVWSWSCVLCVVCPCLCLFPLCRLFHIRRVVCIHLLSCCVVECPCVCGACCVTCGMRCVELGCWLLSGCVEDGGMTCLGRVVQGCRGSLVGRCVREDGRFGTLVLILLLGYWLMVVRAEVTWLSFCWSGSLSWCARGMSVLGTDWRTDGWWKDR